MGLGLSRSRPSGPHLSGPHFFWVWPPTLQSRTDSGTTKTQIWSKMDCPIMDWPKMDWPKLDRQKKVSTKKPTWGCPFLSFSPFVFFHFCFHFFLLSFTFYLGVPFFTSDFGERRSPVFSFLFSFFFLRGGNGGWVEGGWSTILLFGLWKKPTWRFPSVFKADVSIKEPCRT